MKRPRGFLALLVALPLGAQSTTLDPGIAHFNARRWPEAHAFFAGAAKAQPQHPDAAYWMGRTLMAENKAGDASVRSPRPGSAVARTFGSKQALHSTTLELQSGEVVGVAGPNGAGKTTLARLVSGFLAPSAGAVMVGGRSAIDARVTHGVGYLPEELPRAWRCTVGVFLHMRPTAAHALTVERVMEILALGDLAATPLHALSKGQWRLALTAYAALGPSRLLILDEPDSGLDPKALERVRRLVEVCREAGSLVLILSHQMVELDAVCNRLVFMSGGRVLRSVRTAERAGRTAAQLYHELVP